MKKVEFFDRKGYNPKYETIGGEVMMDGICVGEWDWNFYRTRILFKSGDDSDHYGRRGFDSFEQAAQWIVKCGRYDHDYDYYSGAMYFYFNTKTGYDHIANYERTFPLVKKYTIKVEA